MKKESQSLLESFKSNLKKSQNLKESDSKEDFEVVIGDTVDDEPFWYDMMNEYNLNIEITSKDNLNILVTIKGDKSEIQELIKNGFNPNELATIKEEYPELFESFKANLKEDKEFYGGGVNEKVGGDYDDFIYELQNFRASMNIWYNECSTHLAQQIIEDTIMSFDDIIKRYEQQKDIEIIGAMDK